MKSRLVFFVFLAMMNVIFMPGCSDKSTDAKEEQSDLLIGTWTEESLTYDGYDHEHNGKRTVTFEKDNTYTFIDYYGEDSESYGGPYSTSGSTLIFELNYPGTFSYSITGSKSSGYTLTLSGTYDNQEELVEVIWVFTRST